MNTYTYCEFVNTVHFPNDRACIRAEILKQFKYAEYGPMGIAFTCDNDQAVFVPWANVRYMGGCVTPQVVTDNVTVTLPAPVKKPKK